MEELLQVGVVTQTHGIRGEVKVFPTTDDAGRFRDLKKVFLDTGREKLPLEIQGVKFFKQFVIVKFKGLDTINEVERFRRCPLLVPREDAVPLEEDGKAFGTLKDVMETGANDVYVIDSISHGEVLVPAIKECIRKVDVAEGKMTVHLMDGLVQE